MSARMLDLNCPAFFGTLLLEYQSYWSIHNGWSLTHCNSLHDGKITVTLMQISTKNKAWTCLNTGNCGLFCCLKPHAKEDTTNCWMSDIIVCSLSIAIFLQGPQQTVPSRPGLLWWKCGLNFRCYNHRVWLFLCPLVSPIEMGCYTPA